MKAESFCYWLQGFFELQAARANPLEGLTPEQAKIIRNHLVMVFIHEIDPAMGDEKHQEKLDEAHAGLDDLDTSSAATPATKEEVAKIKAEIEKKLMNIVSASLHGVKIRC